MWYFKSFDELTTKELEQIFRLRESIFIVEQQSYFHDIDGNDYNAFHLFNEEQGEIWSYCRILIYDDFVKFGRVTVKQSKRGNGNGRKLISKTFEILNADYPDKDVHIIAMSYLREFYQSFGFKSTSDVFIMDQHPHENMVLTR